MFKRDVHDIKELILKNLRVQGLETPLLQKFGLADVPANLLIDSKGKVVARNMTIKHLEERIHKMLH